MGPPQSLLDAMAEVSAMDTDENTALAQAIVESFGPCTCQQWHIIAGHKVWVEMCAGHGFLTEHDTACTRIQRLRFARARREHWRRDEWGGTSALLSFDLGLD
jgi:hypothetical protein